MKKRIISFILTLALLMNTLLCITVNAAGDIALELDRKYQSSLDALASTTYTITADETQYYEFKIRNQSIEVNTGIGFADGFLNLFLGKMSVSVYDQYNEELTALDIKCGYTGSLSVRFEKGIKYYIKVSTTVSGNYNLIATKLQDLGANTWKDATIIQSTGETVSEIDAAGDNDWFKFTTDALPSYYYFQLENIQASTLYIELYEYVQSADNLRDTAVSGSLNYISVANNKKGSFNLKLKENTEYYICLSSTDSGTGDYILNIERSADAAGNSSSEAYEIQTDITYATSFDGNDDSDYYKFTTPGYDAYYHINYEHLGFTSTVYSNLYDEAGNEINSYTQHYKNDFSYNAKLEKNTTYYVRFKGDGTGNYKFTVNVKADTYPNSRDLATQIELDKTYSTSFDGEDDIDYYKFTTPDYDAYYHINYEHLGFTSTVYSNLYDEAGNEINSYTQHYKYDFSYNAKLEKNTTYYVRFKGDGTGNYKFTVNVKADTYPNSRDLATQIEFDKTYSTSFDGEDDIDYYKFTTPDYDAYYHINYEHLGFTSTVYSNLYDEAGNEIDSYTQHYKYDFSYNAKLEKNTTYYVRFKGDGTGNYKFTVNVKVDNDGDSKNNATALQLNKSYPTSLESSDDEDWFSIELDSATNLLVSVTNESVSANMTFEVYNSRDSKVMSRSYISNGSTGTNNEQVDAGTYYIKVSSNSSGYYTILLSPCGSGHTEQTDYAVPASCTQTGLSEGKHCTVCGAVTKVQTTVSALGHSYNNGTCTRCGEKDPDYVPVFTDVKANAWYKEAVDFAVKNGLFNGTSPTTFEPNTSMTRSMLVTVLWRYAGQPTVGTNNFTDVENGKWYTQAIAWASHYGIVGGIGNGKFDPNGNVTREQMAAILFRYAGSIGIDVSARAELSAYPDNARVSSWASDAVKWTVASGFITGAQKSGYSSPVIDPQGNASRAQVATILMRFVNAIR